jgi:hypothetical protein
VALALGVLFASTVLTSDACSKRPVAPDAVTAHRQAEAMKISHDVTNTLVTANRDGRLTDQQTAAALTINKQVADFIYEHPQGWLDQVKSIIQNGRQALPPDTNAKVGRFLDTLVTQLSEVK